MSCEIKVIFSPCHADAFRDKEHREKSIGRLEEMTGKRWGGEFDENGRFILFLAEEDGKNNQEKRASND